MTMMNEFSDWTTPDRPGFLPPAAEYRTPDEDWARLTSQVQPFWQRRAPMADLGERLRGRYLLAAPYMSAQQGVSPTFAQYLQDYPTAGFNIGAAAPYTTRGSYQAEGQPTELNELRRRAQQAATASITAPGVYLAQATPGTEEFNRRAWLSQQFSGSGSEAARNRMAVANLLAVQRPGGGRYTGRLAGAIRNAMDALAQQRVNVGDPRESFLNWYVNQTRGQGA